MTTSLTDLYKGLQRTIGMFVCVMLILGGFSSSVDFAAGNWIKVVPDSTSTYSKIPKAQSALLTQYWTNWLKNDQKALTGQIHPQFKNKVLVKKTYDYFDTEVLFKTATFKSAYVMSMKAGKADKKIGQTYDYTMWLCLGAYSGYEYVLVEGRLSLMTYKNKVVVTSDDIIDFNEARYAKSSVPDSVIDRSIDGLIQQFGSEYLQKIEDQYKAVQMEYGDGIEPIGSYESFVEERTVTNLPMVLSQGSLLILKENMIVGSKIEEGSFIIKPTKKDKELHLLIENLGSEIALTIEQEENSETIQFFEAGFSGILVYPLEENLNPIEVTLSRSKVIGNEVEMGVIIVEANTASTNSKKTPVFKVPVVLPY